MKFLPPHLHLFHKEVEFRNIQGYDDIKYLVRRVLDSDENYRSAGQCKNIILAILECMKGVYFDGKYR